MCRREERVFVVLCLSPGAPWAQSLAPCSLVVAILRLLLLLTSYPEAGSGDLRRNIFENLFSAVHFGSNLT
jgi:hypothetical protein